MKNAVSEPKSRFSANDPPHQAPAERGNEFRKSRELPAETVGRSVRHSAASGVRALRVRGPQEAGSGLGEKMPHLKNYLETLRRMAMHMGPQRSFQAKARFVLEALVERHGFLRPHLLNFDPQTGTLYLCMAGSLPRNGAVVYEPGVGVTGQVFVTGRPVIVERLLGHPVFMNKFFERTPEEMARLGFISVPVASCVSGDDRQIVGVLGADTPRASREELEARCCFLEAVAALLSSQLAYVQDESARQRRLASVAGTDADDLVAASAGMRAALDQALYAGRHRGPVLITGESGTGKERLAAVVHAASSRGDLPLLRFHGAGLSDEAATRELFGCRKGAFPDALRTCKGLFELARSSSLFIDDVETLSLAVQERLLRAIRDQEITRLGGGDPVGVDVRLICASGEDLERLAASGRFLEELYRRISGSCIRLAPLRERREDILPLARLFLERADRKAGKGVERISAAAQELLCRYAWPGNIHELRQHMEQAAALCEDATLRVGHLPPAVRAVQNEASTAGLSFNDAVARFEQDLLTDALQRARGNMVQAARDLRTSYRIVNYKVKKYGMDPRKFACPKA